MFFMVLDFKVNWKDWLSGWQPSFFYIPLPPNTLPQKRLSHIIANTKKLYKETIWHKTSWKVRNGQLGKFYFPVGKIFFLSWKIIFFQLGTFRSPFWRIFARFWPLKVIISEYQKSFTFSSLLRHKKNFRGRWVLKLDRRT